MTGSTNTTIATRRRTTREVRSEAACAASAMQPMAARDSSLTARASRPIPWRPISGFDACSTSLRRQVSEMRAHAPTGHS